MTSLRTVPRTAVEGYFGVARLPLGVARRVTGQAGNDQWRPLIAFEGLQASVEKTLGSWLGDPVLAEKGRLRHAKLTQLRVADQASALAEEERARAEKALERTRAQAQQSRERAETAARRKEEQLERTAAARTQAAREAAERKAKAARDLKAAQDAALAKAERTATLAALSSESEALAVTRSALEAKETVEVIQDSIEGTKVARSLRT